MRNLRSVLYFTFDIKVLKPERPVSLQAVGEFVIRDIQCIFHNKEMAQNKITDFFKQTTLIL